MQQVILKYHHRFYYITLSVQKNKRKKCQNLGNYSELKLVIGIFNVVQYIFPILITISTLNLYLSCTYFDQHKYSHLWQQILRMGHGVTLGNGSIWVWEVDSMILKDPFQFILFSDSVVYSFSTLQVSLKLPLTLLVLVYFVSS